MNKTRKRILIQKINHLPTLPTIITKIIALTESRNANAANLGEILSRDPSISSTILKLVNSAFYGNLRHISSITHATVILGFQMVKTIAMGVSIYQTAKGHENHGFDRKQFWVHSIGVATMAKVLSGYLKIPEGLGKDAIFLSGLLHDVGKVIFDNYFTEEYLKVANMIREEELWIGDAESRVLGITHCDAGFYLGRKWQFPLPVVETIRFHHDLEKCSEKNIVLCALVHAADHGCRKIGLGSGGDSTVPPLNPLVERYGINPSILDRAIEEVEKERTSLESFVDD